MSENMSLPAWSRANSDRSPHMSLGRTIELKGSVLEQRVAFWDVLYQQYYRDPMPPAPPNSVTVKKLTNFWVLLIASVYFI